MPSAADFKDLLSVPDHSAGDIMVALEKSNPTGINQYSYGGHAANAKENGGRHESLPTGAHKATFDGKDGRKRAGAYVKALPPSSSKDSMMNTYRDGSADVVHR